MSAAPLPSIVRASERTPGCTSACRFIVFFQAGVFGRQSAVLHDAMAHEHYGTDCVIASAEERIVRSGNLAIDLGSLTASVDGVPILLSPTETRLLATLAQRVGKVVRPADIIASAIGQDEEWFSRHNLRTVMSRVRARLGTAGTRIVTHTGLGYRLLANSENYPPTRLRAPCRRPGVAS